MASMDELIDNLKAEGTLSLDEMRWAEHLREQQNEEMYAIRSKDFLWLADDVFKLDPRLTWRQNYEMYLQSNVWKRRRGIAILEGRNKCARCGWRADYKGTGLQVHHKTYKNLGNEPLEDLEVLCKPCHDIADRERDAQTRERQHHALEDARFDGWVAKVDPHGSKDEDVLYERYEAWRERNEEY